MKLYIISGADRVGKSTFSWKLASALPYRAKIVHFSEPDRSPNNPSLFHRYKDTVSQELGKDTEALIFDRSYVCGYILERFRENNHAHLDQLVELEIWLNDNLEEVNHVGIVKPWSFASIHHLKELRQGEPLAPWALTDALISRMNEHRFYYQELFEFYDHITMFPHEINPSF